MHVEEFIANLSKSNEIESETAEELFEQTKQKKNDILDIGATQLHFGMERQQTTSTTRRRTTNKYRSMIMGLFSVGLIRFLLDLRFFFSLRLMVRIEKLRTKTTTHR